VHDPDLIEESSMQLTDKHVHYWRKNLRLTLVLLSIWFVVTFVMGFFARELATITVLGWPLSFYMGAQGSLVVYVVLIWAYEKKMRQLDIEHGVDEGDV
jgi:putative solute:sodium symporter small subunit